MATPAEKGMARIFVMEGGAGPTIAPEFLAWAAPQALDKNFGDVTRTEVPSQTQRNKWDVVGEIQSGEENATLGIMLRWATDLSRVLELASRQCRVDAQVHIGKCTDPRDYNHGWASGKVLAFERGRLTSYSLSEIGALKSEDQENIDEETEISSVRFYEIGPMVFSERAKDEVAQEIIKILVCDQVSCGDCDDPSDGCQNVYAVSAPVGSSPGLIAEVIVSDDGMSTIDQEVPINTLAADEDPDDAACVGDYLVVVSENSLSMHYATKADLLAGTATPFTEVTNGFVAAAGPRAIDAAGPFDVWIVGAGGYVYYTQDPTGSVVVQDAGVATSEDLNDVYAYDMDNVVAVGDNNAVIFTTNGGETWDAVTGPNVGVNLNCVFMRGEKEWWVGDAGGQLWFTKDQGATWTEKGFPGSGVGSVDDIIFASDHVGFLSHTSTSIIHPNYGRILRTISGGHSWYVLPEGSTSIPAADRFNSLAVCEDRVNTVFAGGLGDDAADGIIIKGAGSLG